MSISITEHQGNPKHHLIKEEKGNAGQEVAPWQGSDPLFLFIYGWILLYLVALDISCASQAQHLQDL